MPNIVNEFLLNELEKALKNAGSCLVVSFDKLSVDQVSGLRNQFREAGLDYRVVKNRLAARAVKSALDLDMSETFRGKCGIVFADEENAISAAKLVRDAMKPHKKTPPMTVIGGVVEGEAIVGPAATVIADMPDRETVNTMIASAISGPARSLASVVQAVGGGLARCIQAKIDKEGGDGAASAV